MPLYTAPSHQEQQRRIKGTDVLRDGKWGFPLPESAIESSSVEMGTLALVALAGSLVFLGCHSLELSFLGKLVSRREGLETPIQPQTRIGPQMLW